MSTEENFAKMTVKELRELAKEVPGLTGISSLKKDELIAALQGSRGAGQETKNKKKEAGPSLKALSAREVKERISSVRAQKSAACEGKDKKLLGALRRKLNRLKKQSRKKSAAKAAEPAKE